MRSIVEVLMHRDGMSREAAEALKAEAREELYSRLENGDWKADDICADYFGLEPDYLMELIPY